MDWSQILGDAYVDGMTDEECQAKFNELYVPKSQHETVLQKEKAHYASREIGRASCEA